MTKLRGALVSGIAVVLGVVAVRTLGKLGKQRKTPRQEAAEATRNAVDGAAIAAKHAVAAAGHARDAGEKAAETARGEYRKRRVPGRTTDAVGDIEGGSGARLRKAGEAIIRR